MSDHSAEFWDAEADAFDEEPDHGLHDPVAFDAWRALLLPVVGDRGLIADLGCGTGTLSVLLASAGHSVIGVDFSPRMVALARAKAAAAAADAEFVVGDAFAPPLAAREYDVVLSRHVLWAMPDVGTALDRWIGLLAPGGVLVLVEGSWCTGAGLTRAECVRQVRERRAEAVVTVLDDPVYWGGPIEDDRYLVVSRR